MYDKNPVTSKYANSEPCPPAPGLVMQEIWLSGVTMLNTHFFLLPSQHYKLLFTFTKKLNKNKHVVYCADKQHCAITQNWSLAYNLLNIRCRKNVLLLLHHGFAFCQNRQNLENRHPGYRNFRASSRMFAKGRRTAVGQ